VPAVALMAMLALVAMVVVVARTADATCREHLANWARENGYVLDRVTRRWVTLHLFLRSHVRTFSIEAHDAAGNRMTGEADVGGVLVGALSGRVDVSWY